MKHQLLPPSSAPLPTLFQSHLLTLPRFLTSIRLHPSKQSSPTLPRTWLQARKTLKTALGGSTGLPEPGQVDQFDQSTWVARITTAVRWDLDKGAVRVEFEDGGCARFELRSSSEGAGGGLTSKKGRKGLEGAHQALLQLSEELSSAFQQFNSVVQRTELVGGGVSARALTPLSFVDDASKGGEEDWSEKAREVFEALMDKVEEPLAPDLEMRAREVNEMDEDVDELEEDDVEVKLEEEEDTATFELLVSRGGGGGKTRFLYPEVDNVLLAVQQDYDDEDEDVEPLPFPLDEDIEEDDEAGEDDEDEDEDDEAYQMDEDDPSSDFPTRSLQPPSTRTKSRKEKELFQSLLDSPEASKLVRKLKEARTKLMGFWSSVLLPLLLLPPPSPTPPLKQNIGQLNGNGGAMLPRTPIAYLVEREINRCEQGALWLRAELGEMLLALMFDEEEDDDDESDSDDDDDDEEEELPKSYGHWDDDIMVYGPVDADGWPSLPGSHNFLRHSNAVRHRRAGSRGGFMTTPRSSSASSSSTATERIVGMFEGVSPTFLDHLGVWCSAAKASARRHGSQVSTDNEVSVPPKDIKLWQDLDDLMEIAAKEEEEDVEKVTINLDPKGKVVVPLPPKRVVPEVKIVIQPPTPSPTKRKGDMVIRDEEDSVEIELVPEDDGGEEEDEVELGDLTLYGEDEDGTHSVYSPSSDALFTPLFRLPTICPSTEPDSNEEVVSYFPPALPLRIVNPRSAELQHVDPPQKLSSEDERKRKKLKELLNRLYGVTAKIKSLRDLLRDEEEDWVRKSARHGSNLSRWREEREASSSPLKLEVVYPDGETRRQAVRIFSSSVSLADLEQAQSIPRPLSRAKSAPEPASTSKRKRVASSASEESGNSSETPTKKRAKKEAVVVKDSPTSPPPPKRKRRAPKTPVDLRKATVKTQASQWPKEPKKLHASPKKKEIRPRQGGGQLKRTLSHPSLDLGSLPSDIFSCLPSVSPLPPLPSFSHPPMSISPLRLAVYSAPSAPSPRPSVLLRDSNVLRDRSANRMVSGTTFTFPLLPPALASGTTVNETLAPTPPTSLLQADDEVEKVGQLLLCMRHGQSTPTNMDSDDETDEEEAPVVQLSPSPPDPSNTPPSSPTSRMLTGAVDRMNIDEPMTVKKNEGVQLKGMSAGRTSPSPPRLPPLSSLGLVTTPSDRPSTQQSGDVLVPSLRALGRKLSMSRL